MTPLPSQNIISSRLSYSYLSNLPCDSADIFAVSLLILYCSFSSLMLSLILMTSFCIFSKRISLKRKRFSDTRIASVTKKI